MFEGRQRLGLHTKPLHWGGYFPPSASKTQLLCRNGEEIPSFPPGREHEHKGSWDPVPFQLWKTINHTLCCTYWPFLLNATFCPRLLNRCVRSTPDQGNSGWSRVLPPQRCAHSLRCSLKAPPASVVFSEGQEINFKAWLTLLPSEEKNRF